MAGMEELDPGLDDLGQRQARAAAVGLQTCGASRLVVSPLRRTRETAAPIAATLGLGAIVRPEVAEVVPEGLGPAERQAFVTALLGSRWSAASPELSAWRRRVLDTLVQLAVEPTVVVTHFVAIGAALGAALGDDRVVPAAIANASITTLRVQEKRLVLVSGPDTSHLDAADVTATHTALPGARR